MSVVFMTKEPMAACEFADALKAGGFAPHGEVWLSDHGVVSEIEATTCGRWSFDARHLSRAGLNALCAVAFSEHADEFWALRGEDAE